MIVLTLANGRTRTFDNFIDLFDFVEQRMIARGDL